MVHAGSNTSLRQRIGFWTGIPILLCLLIPPPGSLSAEAFRTLIVAMLMALWWITEAIPIPATSLIPLAAFPLLRILPFGQVAPAYSDSNILLFMGGFFLAMAMQKWGLHRRIALSMIQRIGLSPRKMKQRPK